jgi:hypothetical protein
MNPTTKNLIFCIMGDDWETLASIPLYPQHGGYEVVIVSRG